MVVVRKPVFERLGGAGDAHRCLFGEGLYLWLQLLLPGLIYRWDPAER